MWIGLVTTAPARPFCTSATAVSIDWRTAGAEAGVAVRRPVFKPLHHYLGMDGYPQTEGAFLETVSLPLYPSLSDAEVEAVLDLAGSVLQ